MSDIIHLLPDSIANQIAAGEVIQRPASVVKELVENAIDARADSIQVVIKDAGRTLIQVIDNGKGMSATDALMAFERHATSKIRTAEDLFTLKTMGFRGEALPSIAAIAHVELRTRRDEDEVGSLLSISASKVEKQELTVCPKGSNFVIKNIFFNVPARRKFLKSNDTEKKNILTEFERIVLVNPQIYFSFVENDIEIHRYPISNLKQRIINLIGKHINQQLINIEIKTTLVRIVGFVGKPESARKTRALQYFFVNGRYMRHPYFNRAVTLAFDRLIPMGENPNYFIYLEVEPDTIDVNIHPTKTEIKFENEQAIWQILSATVKEALGRFNEVPTIDFDTQDAISIPMHNPSKITSQPQLNIDHSYNPFKQSQATNYQRPKFDWESLYKGLESEVKNGSKPDEDLFESIERESLVSQDLQTAYYQYKHKYILTSAKSGLMIIDQRRAHIRILFDQFLINIRQQRGVSQRVLFPDIIEFSPSEESMIPYLIDDFEAVGFDLNNLGNGSYAINGVPSEINQIDPIHLIHNMVNKSIETGSDVKEEIQESLALSLAQATAINSGHVLSQTEIENLVSQLFSCTSHNHTPDGKTIIALYQDENIERMFK